MRAVEEEAANTRAAEEAANTRVAEEAANMRAAEAAEKKKKKSEEEAKKRKAEEEARTKKAAEEMAKKKAAEEVAKSTKEEEAADVDALSAEAPSPVEAHAVSPVALAEGADAEPSFMSVAPTAQQGDDESPTPSEVVLPTTASAEDPAGPAIDSTDSDAAASLAEEANKADHRAHQMSPHEEEQNRLPINDVKLVPQLGDAAPQEEAVPLDEAVPLRVLLAQREAQPRPTEPSVLKKVCPLASNRSSQSSMLALVTDTASKSPGGGLSRLSCAASFSASEPNGYSSTERCSHHDTGWWSFHIVISYACAHIHTHTRQQSASADKVRACRKF
jgi:hypothetical protein